MKHEAWARDAAWAAGRQLTSDQLGQLVAYGGLLRRVAIRRGMIAASDADRLWERHIVDGLRGAREIPRAASVADVGSGAGIPGIPLAVARAGGRFALIEPRRSRAAFLEAAVDSLGLSNVEVLPQRVDEVLGPFDVCVARAFASPVETWDAAQRVLAPTGILVYWAGESFDEGVLAERRIPFRLSTPSDLAPTGPLVIMGPQ